MCKAIGKPPVDWFEVMENRALLVVNQQEYLGRDAIIKGFHVWEWAYALEDLWMPPQVDEHGKKEKKMDPFEMSVSLLQVTWDIFEKLWETRNSILHSLENHLHANEVTQITTRLIEF